jgi:glycosyltransferase involved in cell wall biosynthesis
MMKISLLMPTRKRVARAEAFLQTVVDTAADLSQIEVIAAIDHDDPESKQLTSPDPRLSLIQTIGSRASMGTLNSRCLAKASGDLIMLVNDDILIRSQNWDQVMLEKAAQFPDEVFLMHTRDGHKDEKFPIFPILSKRGCSLLKDPYPSHYCGDGIDMHLFDLFLRLKDFGHNRIIYLPEVFFEHMHVGLRKAPNDPIYESRNRIKSNQTFYTLWKKRELSAQRLADAIDGKEGKIVFAPYNKKNSYHMLLISFLQSRQTKRFKIHYLLYHLVRETYIRLHLEKVKASLYDLIIKG